MSDIRVKSEKIENMMRNAKTTVYTAFDKCTIVAMQFDSGFVLVGSSACVDPENYDVELGVKYAKEHIKDQLWTLEGYFLQKIEDYIQQLQQKKSDSTKMEE